MTKNCIRCGAANPPRTYHAGPERKFCSKTCSHDAWVDAHPEQRKAHVQKYDHSEHGRVRRKDWEQKTAPRLKERRHENYEKNKDRELALMAEWRKNNPEQSKSIKKKYAQTEQGRRKSLETTHRRLARKHNAPGGHFTWDEFEKVCQEFDYTCLSCLKVLPFDEIEADHVVALANGGSDDIWNIQPLCRSCNPRKGKKTIDYRPLYRERAGKRDWLLGAPNLGGHAFDQRL